MTATLRRLWHAQPFVPFELQLADGRKVWVPHSDHFTMSPKGHEVIVSHDDEDSTYVNPRVIASITVAGESISVDDAHGNAKA